jgi:hypothetical protein
MDTNWIIAAFIVSDTVHGFYAMATVDTYPSCASDCRISLAPTW